MVKHPYCAVLETMLSGRRVPSTNLCVLQIKPSFGYLLFLHKTCSRRPGALEVDVIFGPHCHGNRGQSYPITKSVWAPANLFSNLNNTEAEIDEISKCFHRHWYTRGVRRASASSVLREGTRFCEISMLYPRVPPLNVKVIRDMDRMMLSRGKSTWAQGLTLSSADRHDCKECKSVITDDKIDDHNP